MSLRFLVDVDLEKFRSNAVRAGTAVDCEDAKRLLAYLGFQSHPSGRYECDGETLKTLEPDEVRDVTACQWSEYQRVLPASPSVRPLGKNFAAPLVGALQGGWLQKHPFRFRVLKIQAKGEESVGIYGRLATAGPLNSRRAPQSQSLL